jgi:hypothetical protein
MDSALDVLELGRVRGLNTVLEKKMIEKGFDDHNSSRFQTLVARVEVKIEIMMPPAFVPLQRL